MDTANGPMMAPPPRAAWPEVERRVEGQQALGISHDMVASLHRAIASASHPGCAACSALLPVLAAYLGSTVTPPA